MKSFVIVLVIIIVSVASSKPIEEINEEHILTNADKIPASNGHHFGDKLSWEDQTTPKDVSNQYSLSYYENNFPEKTVRDDRIKNPNDKPSRPKRQLLDEIVLNKQFFDQVFQSSRISRDTNDVPTIALHDLIHSVEDTLIHSAQNLAVSNVTTNLTNSVTETNSNNVINTHHTSIVLPITIPTPAPKSTTEFVTESVEITTVAEHLIRDSRSDDEKVFKQNKTDFESVKPIEISTLGLLFPITLNPSVDLPHVNLSDDEEHTDAPVIEVTKSSDQSNITIIQTINSTQIIPTDSSDVVHVHKQHITLFSANAGIFPNIHAVKAEDLPVLATQEEDCSGEETSDELSSEESSTSGEKSDSNSSHEEKDKQKKVTCTRKSSVATSSTVENTTPLTERVKKIKTEELKEKIAEVEADPVILTQGI